jgi:hypothetical protein
METMPGSDAEDFSCIPCKLLLNSGSLIGIIRGVFATKKHLNKIKKDFSPEFYAKAIKIVCTAHEQMAELEKDAAQGPFVDLP